MTDTTQEIIIVRQLPIIEERLKSISAEIKERVSEVLSLECSDETVKEIKKARAELAKGYRELEAQRKAVKNKVLAPYEQFEQIYRECVTDIYAPADAELKSRIDEVENELKSKKREEVTKYFKEYAQSQGLDWLTFEQANIQVSLSSSIKGLKTTATLFIDQVKSDLNLIDMQENREEVLVEYRKSLNLTNAMTTVKLRQQAIKEELQRKERIRAAQEQRETAAAAVVSTLEESTEFLSPPQTVAADEDVVATEPLEKVYITTFRVRGTLSQLKALKMFLTDGGYEYESI